MRAGAWTAQEKKIVAVLYPRMGDVALEETGLLPGRNANAIRSQAVRMKVRRED